MLLQVKSLDFSKSIRQKRLGSSQLIALSNYYPELVQLNVSGCPLIDDGFVDEIVKIEALHNLTDLNLSRTTIKSKGNSPSFLS
jgi:hypothetical protein